MSGMLFKDSWGYGCDVADYCREPAYMDMKTNRSICDSYASIMNSMGYSTIVDAAGQKGGLSGGSTDMGMSRILGIDEVNSFADMI